MLRILTLLLSGLCTVIFSYAQTPECKSLPEIARMESGRFLQPEMHNRTLASTEMDVHFYRCRWEVDPAVRAISGSVGFHFLAKQAMASATVDLQNALMVDSVKRGTEHLAFNRITDAVTIQLSAPLAAGSIDSFTVYYSGVPTTTGFGSFFQSSHGGVPVLWTLSEPYGSMDWWPCKNGLDDKADSIDITLVYPDEYLAVTNGLPQGEVTLTGNRKMQTWKHRYPVTSYLVAFAVTNYTELNHSVQLGSTQLPMVTYCYPEHAFLFENSINQVLNQLKLFHDTLVPYPFLSEKYGHTQFGWGGGMEHQTNSFVVIPDENLVAHELAHQWFGNMITTGSWEEIWLNEGFATHFASYYMERAYPASAIPNRRAQVMEITSLPGGSVKVTDTTDVGRIFSNRLSYSKGAHLVYMLRLKLGDADFFRGIRNYLSDPALRYGYARNTHLIAHLEAASGKDLTRFFEQWYEGEGYPTYHAEWGVHPSGITQVKLSQTTSHPSVTFFEMPVPVVFQNATQQQTVLLDAVENNQEFLLNLGFIPDTILIDPEYWLISRNNTAEKIQLSNPGDEPDDIWVYPNPAHGPVTLFIRVADAADATAVLFNSVGQRIWVQKTGLTNGIGYMNINMAALSSGVYYLRIHTSGKTFLKKLIR